MIEFKVTWHRSSVRSLFDGLWKQNSIAGGLDPRLLQEVGDLFFTIASAYRFQIPLIFLRRRLLVRYRTTPEDNTGANREPVC